MPECVQGLGQCLMEYLHLDSRYIHIQRSSENFEEEELSAWTLRPLPKRLEKVAVKHVIYLKDLRLAILEHLLSDLNEGIDIYLSVLRECSEEELQLNPSLPHLLPPAFQGLQNKENKRMLQHFKQPNDARVFEITTKIEDFKIRSNDTCLKNPKESERLSKEVTIQENSKKYSVSQKQTDKDSSVREINSNSKESASNNNEILLKMVPTQCIRNMNFTHPKKRIDWPIKNNSDSSPEYIPAGMMGSSTSKKKAANKT
ncbi:uncharacterized protein LOC111642591 [Centruroides sculpturatus]|uniref:uncharacterized protein LOC111642591 n=1 Tax=Centruroides sculpturatus TaxID=218467 RepID=UPI000C6DEC23|nr:uncharacterized protein LOC111642591 [Centruroides sculpturatus]